MFTPLNVKPIQLGCNLFNAGTSACPVAPGDGTGACPVKFMIMMSVAYFTGVHPVKFFEKDSAADLTGVGRDYRTGVECFFLFNWGVAYSIGAKPISLGFPPLNAVLLPKLDGKSTIAGRYDKVPHQHSI